MALDIFNEANRTIHITAIRAVIISRRVREAGIRVCSPSAGAVEVVPCFIDLDDNEPVGRHAWYPEVEGYDPFYPPDFTDYELGDQLALTLAPDEFIPVRITARTRKYACTWRLELDLVDGHRRESVLLPSDGSDLRTVAQGDDDEDYQWAWWARPLRVGPARDIYELEGLTRSESEMDLDTPTLGDDAKDADNS
jgi:hypothetical protein